MAIREPQWPMFHRVWRRADLTDRMIGELGVDPISAARLDRGDAYQAACAICLTCPAARDCRNWLDAAEQLPLPPDFCPNKQFFERCLLRQKNVN